MYSALVQVSPCRIAMLITIANRVRAEDRITIATSILLSILLRKLYSSLLSDTLTPFDPDVARLGA
tara:strand:- start:312 stop:509 length:198 start_codon:yes stop_codon:yes gene_type:complete